MEKEGPTDLVSMATHSQELRVLVVDVSEATRDVLRQYICSWKWQAEAAGDAALGLKKLASAAREGHPFHVALLDWKMPDMDGLALAKRIKEDGELCHTALVLLSGFAQNNIEEITQAGFASSIQKPASKSDLYEAITAAACGEVKTASPVVARKPGPAAPAHGTILLAEDNEINHEVAGEMLSDLGYQHQWVRNSKEAVNAWEKGQIELVLMDCRMPEMDGYKATSEIRLMEKGQDGRRVPIVALTAHATQGDRDRCLEAGMDDYLTKPLNPDLLSRTIARWMENVPAVSNALPEGSAASEYIHEANSGDPAVPSTPKATEPDPVDYSRLLRRCGGKQKLAERLVRILEEQANRDAANIATAVDQADAEGLAAAAHRLKGAAANVSAEGLRVIAAELEERGRGGNLAGAASRVEQLQRELARLTQTAPKLK